jgi:hypothetical protein
VTAAANSVDHYDQSIGQGYVYSGTPSRFGWKVGGPSRGIYTCNYVLRPSCHKFLSVAPKPLRTGCVLITLH